MNRFFVLIIAGLCLATLLIGCSGNNPTVPSSNPELTKDSLLRHPELVSGSPQLWGYYDIHIDIENQTIVATPNRSVNNAYNVVTFLNGNLSLMEFAINEIVTDPDFVDVDIDVSLTHPLPGQIEYNGYDVRGIFMGNSSAQLDYNPAIEFGLPSEDQTMLDDPDDNDGGGPDGFTRWFNATEFLTPGILGYTHGKVATPGYTPNATLNPYKLFADGLGSHENAFEFVSAESGSGNNVFSANAKNTRNYYLRFPLPSPNVTYGYAVVADWIDPTTHPANAPEVVTANLSTIASDINFNAPDIECGNFVLDVSLAGYGKQPSTIYIEADELFATPLQVFDPTVILIDSGATYSTYHIDIPVDNVTSSGYKEFWVIAEYDSKDYSNEFGVLNDADGPLSAFFQGTVLVGSESCAPPNQDPVCDVQVITPMPHIGWAGLIEFDASASSDPDGDPLTFDWDFNNDGTFGDTYDAGTDANPQKMFVGTYTDDVCVKVTDGQGGESICCVAVDITAYQTKNIPLRTGVEARDLAVDAGDGDILILYSDGQVWKYNEPYTYASTFTGALFYSTGINYLWYIEASANGDSLVNSGTSGGPFASRSYYASGTFAISRMGLSNNTWNSDGWCPTSGTWNGRHCHWYKTFLPPPSDTVCVGYDPPAYGSFGGFLFTEGLGPDYIDHNYLVGTETDSSGNVYSLEKGNQYSVERRAYRFEARNGPYWGAFGDTSPNFNDPRDITRNNSSPDTIYVLDELSTGDPAIKKFTWDGSPLGTFGDTSSISSTPLRIEGSQRIFPPTGENLMFVLHGNATDGFFLSIFLPSELT